MKCDNSNPCSINVKAESALYTLLDPTFRLAHPEKAHTSTPTQPHHYFSAFKPLKLPT